MAAAPLYAALPVVVELLVEAGCTRVYSRVADVGFAAYLGYFVLYMGLVEVGVYCMHRGLHDFRPGYKYAKPSNPFHHACMQPPPLQNTHACTFADTCARWYACKCTYIRTCDRVCM